MVSGRECITTYVKVDLTCVISLWKGDQENIEGFLSQTLWCLGGTYVGSM